MKTAAMMVLSVAWLVPLFLGVSSYLRWLEIELWPRLEGKTSANSFPFLAFSRQMFGVALLLLAAAIATWVFLWMRKIPI